MADMATEGATPAVLLIEDDEDLAAMLADALGAKDYRVWHVPSARQAELLVGQIHPSLIIIDLMLPDRNGLILCSDLKARAAVPIIICSGTKRKDDAVLALKLGADDFIDKPFSVDELQARMEAVLRRTGSPQVPPAVADSADVQHIEGLVIDHARCSVALDGLALQLTPTEYRLLCAIAARPRQVVSRGELADAIWGTHDIATLQSLEVHMRHLRAKLTSAGSSPRVVTRRGFGYQLMEASPDE
jgi:DNA-binding response OmpR family regulator